jgi:hypothetical protein
LRPGDRYAGEAALTADALSPTAAPGHRQREIDLRRLEIDPGDQHSDAPGQLEYPAAALADHRVAPGVKMEIVAAELGDVDQAVDVETIQRDEDSEIRDSADRTVERLADLVLHEIALEPVLDVARRVVGATFGERAVHAELGP